MGSSDINIELQADLSGNINEKVNELNKELESVGTKAEDINESIEKLGNTIEKSFEGARTDFKEFSEAIKKNGDRLSDISKSIVNLGRTFHREKEIIVSVPRELAKESEKANFSLQKIQSSIVMLGKAFATGKLIGGLKEAVKQYANFEAGILKIQTISDVSFERIQDVISLVVQQPTQLINLIKEQVELYIVIYKVKFYKTTLS